VNEASFLQALECLSNDRSGHAEPIGEYALRGKPIAMLKAALIDIRCQCLNEFIFAERNS
jgi:hypothetical protein